MAKKMTGSKTVGVARVGGKKMTGTVGVGPVRHMAHDEKRMMKRGGKSRMSKRGSRY